MKETSTNELKDKLLHDFTLLSNIVNSSVNSSLKHISRKCKILTPEEVKQYFKKLNMVRVRNAKKKTVESKNQRRTNRAIREAIVDELNKAPTLSLYAIKQATKIDYQTIRRFIFGNKPMFEVVKQGGATYVKIKDEYRRLN